MQTLRTQVAIVGAGPAGMLLAHLLDEAGVESVVVERRSEKYVAARIRAGILEQSTVDLLRSVDLGAGVDQHGDEHTDIYLQWPHKRHHIDFKALVGRTVWGYGQTQVQADLVGARKAAGQQVVYEVEDTAVHDIEGGSSHVTFTRGGEEHRLEAKVVAGCDGSFGPCRAAVPERSREVWQKTYPYSWLGTLADAPPSTDELIYAWHPEGFALHSMRSHAVSRLYLQVPNDTRVDTWSDDRIWEQLATRLGHGQDVCELEAGPITEKAVLPLHSYVRSPMRHGNLFLAGDAAHIVPPTGAAGLNLAVADVALLAPALAA